MSLTANRNYKTYSFKSVGSKEREVDPERNAKTDPPIGIQTPLRLSRGEGLFSMHTDLTKQIADNLRNLLQTNHGERLGHPDFGANLNSVIFDLGSEAGDEKAVQMIASTVGKYMPFVSLDGFQSFTEKTAIDTLALVGIKVSYTIPSIDNKLRTIEVMLYMGG